MHERLRPAGAPEKIIYWAHEYHLEKLRKPGAGWSEDCVNRLNDVFGRNAECG